MTREYTVIITGACALATCIQPRHQQSTLMIAI